MEVVGRRRISGLKPLTRRVNKVRPTIKLDNREQARRATEDTLSQRLFSIVLAANAANAEPAPDPVRLQRILDLIRTQSAASLEDLRRLSSLR